MPVSYASVSPTNFELTPMKVLFDSIDLGGTLENVTVSVETNLAEIKADQFGETILDRVVNGQTIKITTSLAEIKFKDNWKVAFPHFNLVTSGPNKQIYIDSRVGSHQLSDAKELKLHPLSLADADKSGDYMFYKAVATGASELVYGPGEQVKMKVEWLIFPDTSTTPARFGIFGDPAIGLVAASAGSPILVGTGNGTMTSVAVFNNTTKTETITATCVTAAVNGGVFHVSGSVSGSLGLATVGVGFSSPVIAFLINDGATDFVVGDVFTVATTASNYV